MIVFRYARLTNVDFSVTKDAQHVSIALLVVLHARIPTSLQIQPV